MKKLIVLSIYVRLVDVCIRWMEWSEKDDRSGKINVYFIDSLALFPGVGQSSTSRKYDAHGGADNGTHWRYFTARHQAGRTGKNACLRLDSEPHNNDHKGQDQQS